jgi:hypothetical protein
LKPIDHRRGDLIFNAKLIDKFRAARKTVFRPFLGLVLKNEVFLLLEFASIPPKNKLIVLVKTFG